MSLLVVMVRLSPGRHNAAMSHFRPGWDALPSKLRAFHDEYHLASLTTLRPDSRPHAVPVGVTLDPERGCAWVITMRGSRKVAHVNATAGGAPVVLCQVDGPRWASIEGRASVVEDAESVARAMSLYAARYGREPAPNPERVALRIEVDVILHGPLLDED